jgi:hypothetical protein
MPEFDPNLESSIESGVPTNGDTQQPETTGDSKFSSAFARLAKKEQSLRKERESFSSEREALKKELEELKSYKEKYTGWESKKANARLNPKAALDDLGLSFDELQEYFLNGGQPSANALVEELRKELESTKSEFQKKLEEKELESQRLQVERQEREFKWQLSKAIQDSDAEFLKAHDAPDDTLYQLIKSWYEKNGEVLDTTEAIKLLESELEDQFNKRYGKLDKVSRMFKAHLGTPMQTPQFQERSPGPVPSYTSQAYKQRTMPSAPMGASGADRKLSEAERIQLAASLMTKK